MCPDPRSTHHHRANIPVGRSASDELEIPRRAGSIKPLVFGLNNAPSRTPNAMATRNLKYREDRCFNGAIYYRARARAVQLRPRRVRSSGFPRGVFSRAYHGIFQKNPRTAGNSRGTVPGKNQTTRPTGLEDTRHMGRLPRTFRT